MYKIKITGVDNKIIVTKTFERAVKYLLSLNTLDKVTYESISKALNTSKNSIKGICLRAFTVNKEKFPSYIKSSTDMIYYFSYLSTFSSIDNFLLNKGIRISSRLYAFLRFILINYNKYSKLSNYYITKDISNLFGVSYETALTSLYCKVNIKEFINEYIGGNIKCI